MSIFSNGQWEATNLSIGAGINALIAVRVNDAGHKQILQRVKNQQWSKIDAEEVKTLPGYKELARVSVKTPDPK